MTTTSNASLVIGRGELFFGRFIEGTLVSEGEIYLGNTPGFSISRTIEEIERFTSYGGQQIQIDSLITREVHSADITTDNINVDNLALWFGGDVDDSGQEAVGNITENIVVKRGRYFQLGTTVEPWGVRHVEPGLTFVVAGTPIPIAGNLVLDREEGRFYVEPNAPDLPDGTTVAVTFQWRQSFSVTMDTSPKEVIGSLRYIAKNPFGPRISYFFPYVRLKPTSQIELKSDQWQEFSFEVDIRRLNPTTSFFYVTQIAVAQYTDDELAIIELGPMSLEVFPYYEDQLDIIINTDIPNDNFGAPL